MTQRRDYYVSFLSEEYIANTAARWRRADLSATSPDFNVVKFVNDVLRVRLSTKKGELHIKLIDVERDDEVLAYVDIDPLTLTVDRELWGLANIGDPFARFVLAHEIGHVILHGNYEKAAFSNDSANRLKFGTKEYSAEWQADKFAEHFLLPSYLVSQFSSPSDLASACSVSRELATKRFIEVREQIMCKQYSSDVCPVCGQCYCTEMHWTRD